MCRITVYRIYCADYNKFIREHRGREYCERVDKYCRKGYQPGLDASWPDEYGRCATGETINTFTDTNAQRCFACKRKKDERGESLKRKRDERGESLSSSNKMRRRRL